MVVAIHSAPTLALTLQQLRDIVLYTCTLKGWSLLCLAAVHTSAVCDLVDKLARKRALGFQRLCIPVAELPMHEQIDHLLVITDGHSYECAEIVRRRKLFAPDRVHQFVIEVAQLELFK